MVVPDILPKLIMFFLLSASFNSLVIGEQAVAETFPDPSPSLEVEENEVCTNVFGIEFCLPDIVSMAIDFITWPFRIANWFWDLSSFGFIEGTPPFITLPLRVGAAATTGFAFAPLILRLFDSIGQVLPFT